MGDKPYATSPPYGGAPPPGAPHYPPQEYDRLPPQHMQAPPPAQGVPVASTTVLPAKVQFVPGVSPPPPPPGFAYVLKEECNMCAVILAILFFPWGLLFLLCMKDRYWVLVPLA